MKSISITGISASNGIAIGKIRILKSKKWDIRPRSINSKEVKSQLKKCEDTIKQLSAELSEMGKTLDKATKEIFETQLHILGDPELKKQISTIIRDEKLSADYAVFYTFGGYIERLKESGSDLFQQRIVDLENIRDKMLEQISGEQSKRAKNQGGIVIARELSPADLISLHSDGLKALVTEKGGVTSHSALIASSLGIPCIVNAKGVMEQAEMGTAIVDGKEGLLILNPSEKKISEYKKKLEKLSRKRIQQKKNILSPSVTKTGSVFKLMANVEFSAEIKQAQEYRANGVGLLRTEALLFQGAEGEDQQIHFYKNMLDSVEGDLVIRLFDVGGDKLNFRTPDEANPFLGWRGIRMLLDEHHLLRIQLTAILKASVNHHGRIKILVPMITVIDEVLKVKEIIEEVSKEMKDQKIKYDSSIPLGVMIEVPSAALIADKLAKVVDFFSIGTNDLTQYTLAVDRGNDKISQLYQQHHPAVWKLIWMTQEAGVKNGIPVSVCGELAGDVMGACGLIGMGINVLSMVPSFIPAVKEELISHKDEDFKKLADFILNAETSEEINLFFKNWRKH